MRKRPLRPRSLARELLPRVFGLGSDSDLVLCCDGLPDPRGREEGGGRHTVAPLVDLHGQVRGRARPGDLGSAESAEAGGWEIQRRPETPLRAMPDTALRSPAGGMLGLPYGVAGWSLLTKLRFSQRTEPYDRGGSDVSGHISLDHYPIFEECVAVHTEGTVSDSDSDTGLSD